MNTSLRFLPVAVAAVLAGCATRPDAVKLPDAPASAGAVCHRVSQNGVGTYCGSAGQWADLAASSGFKCVTTVSNLAALRAAQAGQGARDSTVPPRRELCATAQEWQRIAKRSDLHSAAVESQMAAMGSSAGGR